MTCHNITGKGSTLGLCEGNMFLLSLKSTVCLQRQKEKKERHKENTTCFHRSKYSSKIKSSKIECEHA